MSGFDGTAQIAQQHRDDLRSSADHARLVRSARAGRAAQRRGPAARSAPAPHGIVARLRSAFRLGHPASTSVGPAQPAVSSAPR
jgi:hypothetical protein